MGSLLDFALPSSCPPASWLANFVWSSPTPSTEYGSYPHWGLGIQDFKDSRYSRINATHGIAVTRDDGVYSQAMTPLVRVPASERLPRHIPAVT